MEEKELIAKIQQLKQIKPNQEWVSLAKSQILGEEANRNRVSVGFLPGWKPALVTVGVFVILFGFFGFAQDSLPGDLLYPLKKISEKAQVVFMPAEEKPQVNLELANKRLEELNKLAQTDQASKLAPALNEFQETKSAAKKEVSQAIKSKPKEEALQFAKEVASKLNEIEKKEGEVLSSLGIEKGEASQEDIELDFTFVQMIQSLVTDLETRTLTPEDAEVLEEIKTDIEQGNHTEAFIKILDLTQK